MSSFQVTFVCRICGKTEICAVWNPMTTTEICARNHTPQQFRDLDARPRPSPVGRTSSEKSARDG